MLVQQMHYQCCNHHVHFSFLLNNKDDEENSADNIDEFEAILEEEFPSEEDPVDAIMEETVGMASDRIEAEIEARFITDGETFSEVTVQEIRNITCQMFIIINFIFMLSPKTEVDTKQSMFT